MVVEVNVWIYFWISGLLFPMKSKIDYHEQFVVIEYASIDFFSETTKFVLELFQRTLCKSFEIFQ